MKSADVRQDMDAVLAEYGVTRSDIMGHSRKREIVSARHEIWRRLHKRGYGLSEIARGFGTDHSTVSYALQGGRRGRAQQA